MCGCALIYDCIYVNLCVKVDDLYIQKKNSAVEIKQPVKMSEKRNTYFKTAVCLDCSEIIRRKENLYIGEKA